MTKATRHILSLLGGKDSSALAVFMRGKVPEMEYVFCDTGKELAETYEYLAKLEAYLGKPIVRLNPERGFDHWLEVYGGYLPSPRMRWCTRQLKLKPFEDYIGNDPVVSYVGIRGDEDRTGYISTKPNIRAVFPFKEAGLGHADILRLLFEASKAYEKTDPDTGQRFTWSQSESLAELAQPERLVQIRGSKASVSKEPDGNRLTDLLDEDDEDDQACAICTL